MKILLAAALLLGAAPIPESGPPPCAYSLLPMPDGDHCDQFTPDRSVRCKARRIA